MKLPRRKTAVSLDDRLGGLALAADLADGRLAADAVAGARSVVSRAGVRRSLSVEHTVVALAGATGSGKSSLFNALSGTSLAMVGVTRPTTSTAQAALWDGQGAGPLLDWLEIPRRHEVAHPEDGTAGLILLDLPDHDSIELTHRLEVDRLVELVDVLVWVLDPQKYADAAVHDRYLRPLARHRDVTVVVLNQTDRLPPAAAERCLKDLRRLLDGDGLAEVPLAGVSARTGTGLPELRALLVSRVVARRSWAARLAADVGRAADILAGASIGPVPTAPAAGGTTPTAPAPIAKAPAVPSPTAPASTAQAHAATVPSGAVPTATVPTATVSPGTTPGRMSPGGMSTASPSAASFFTAPESGSPASPAPTVSVDGLAGPLTDALSEAAGVPVVVAAVAKAHRHRSVAATGWPPTRWIRRFRPDPLRRLRIGMSVIPGVGRDSGGKSTGKSTGDSVWHTVRESAGESERDSAQVLRVPVGRTSMPVTTAVQRSRMDTAVREVAGAASAGLPEPWAAAVRRAARSRAEELEDGLDRAVATTSLGTSRRPVWWRVTGLAQWLVFAVTLAGGLWLLGLLGLDYLRLPRPYMPTAGELPWPTVLLIGGVVLGLLIAGLSRAAAWIGGRRRARKAARALRVSVERVARGLVLEPVGEELSRYHRFTEAVTLARKE
ncbi:GTPase [Streptosporangium sp. NPDC051022]|uniref:GTPase n=1 Tax=Streptosporangium sp. NPDC051022 TaxID=3155752 RepID=UPI00341547B6